jgi:TatD DNase family protein
VNNFLNRFDSSYLFDVHAHLTHSEFIEDFEKIVADLGRENIVTVCNGLEPESNRRILEYAKTYRNILPALGIYPIDAICNALPEDFKHKPKVFDVEAEIEFIREKAVSQDIVAVGECGLDGYWVGPEYQAMQENVFEKLIGVAKSADLPIIVHSRSLEERTLEVLAHNGAKRVDMHCFSGRTALAQTYAEKYGWCFSIPANARRSGSFTKMIDILPAECLLTETDSPYLPAEKGLRNTPHGVLGTTAYMAERRGMSFEQCRELLFNNVKRLFNSQSLV